MNRQNLEVAPTLLKAAQLVARRPLGVLWIQFQVVFFSVATLGILTGPLMVGLFRVYGNYVQTNEWRPEALWGNRTRTNILAGLVYVAFVLVLFNARYLGGKIFWVLAALVFTLIWFYTFQILAAHQVSWRKAFVEGFDILIAKGLPQHVLLAGIFWLLTQIPLGKISLPLEGFFWLVLGSFSSMVRAVAYSTKD